MAIVEISIVPLGTGSPGISEYVAECIRVLEKEKVPYTLTAMGTVIEGDIGRLFPLLEKMHGVPFSRGPRGW